MVRKSAELTRYSDILLDIAVQQCKKECDLAWET
jgi:hypothetical protein